MSIDNLSKAPRPEIQTPTIRVDLSEFMTTEMSAVCEELPSKTATLDRQREKFAVKRNAYLADSLGMSALARKDRQLLRRRGDTVRRQREALIHLITTEMSDTIDFSMQLTDYLKGLLDEERTYKLAIGSGEYMLRKGVVIKKTEDESKAEPVYVVYGDYYSRLADLVRLTDGIRVRAPMQSDWLELTSDCLKAAGKPSKE